MQFPSFHSFHNGISENASTDLEKIGTPTTFGFPSEDISPLARNLLPTPVVHNSFIPHKPTFSTLTRLWRRLNKSSVTSTLSVSSVVQVDAIDYFSPNKEDVDNDIGLVDEVIVDRVWSERNCHSVCSDGHIPGEVSLQQGNTRSTNDPTFQVHHGEFGASPKSSVVLPWAGISFARNFFFSRFADEKLEKHYQEEMWFGSKRTALCSTLFLILNWVIASAFLKSPLLLIDKIFFFIVSPLLLVPLTIMVVWDIPRSRSVIYQLVLCVSTWSWSFYLVIYIYLCGYYDVNASDFSCGKKDFMAVFYYTSALPSTALFGLRMNRFPAMVAPMIYLVVSCSLIVPIHISWTRNMINFCLYHGFIIYMHYTKEEANRRMYTLQDQLRIQVRRTQEAQVNERQASDSKRKLTSYIFHDKKLQFLAVQNIDASSTVAQDQHIEFNALEGSLTMMSKVLNDVLDFNRMDSGRLECVSSPYTFHQVMHSLCLPLRLTTNARNLEFAISFDKNIDEIGRRAAYEAMGKSSEEIDRHMLEYPDELAIVAGDETRLRQIISNLASNACKFTPSGGKVSLSTQLVWPIMPPKSESASRTPIAESEASFDIKREGDAHSLSTGHVAEHNRNGSKTSALLEWIVVRIEVTDNGYGIKPSDMAHDKLFSAFNQTEMGRHQGGKGSGLGLALVRQIVKLSGGRLGVKSQVGVGSTFWVEIPLGVGPKITLPSDGISVSLGRKAMRSESGISNHTIKTAERSTHLMVEDTRSLFSSSSSSAMLSLMEHAGPVELLLSKRHAHTKHPLVTSAVSSTSTRYSSSPDVPASEEPPACILDPKLSQDELPEKMAKSSRTLDSQSPTIPSRISASNLSSLDGQVRGNSASATAIRPGLDVLVVDDDPLTRTLMKRLLTRLGCNVTTAENGQVALEMILELTTSSDVTRYTSEQGSTPSEKYAVVFLDNQMPILSGLKAVAKLRALGRRDFVVGVTGNALRTDQEEYLEAGVDVVLTKPVLEQSLRSMLDLADVRRKAR